MILKHDETRLAFIHFLHYRGVLCGMNVIVGSEVGWCHWVGWGLGASGVDEIESTKAE